MKHIYLEPGVEWVAISAIPKLVADAFYPEEADNALATLAALKKRATKQRTADQWCGNGNNFCVSLNDDDLAWLNAGPWRDLPPLRFAPEPRELLTDFIDPPSLDMWISDYLPALAAHAPEDWDLHWEKRSPQAVQQVLHHETELKHRDGLQKLSIAGMLVGRDHHSRAPVPAATGERLFSLDLSVYDFERYLQPIGITIQRRKAKVSDDDVYAASWYDKELKAEAWLKRKIVTPAQAAMLLCELNPKATSIEDARRTTTTETSPDDFNDLLDAFEEAHQLDPSFRTLLQWLELARGAGLEYHRWIDRYLEQTSLQRRSNEQHAVSTGGPVLAAVLPAASGEERSLAVESAPEAQRVIVRTTKAARRDVLTPLIEQAQAMCKAPSDSAEVWGNLLAMAEKSVGALVGVSDEGIKYLKDGGAEFLTRDALRKRVDRMSGR